MFNCYMAPFAPGMAQKFSDTAETFKEVYTKAGLGQGTRQHHVGLQIGFGFNPRFKTFFGPKADYPKLLPAIGSFLVDLETNHAIQLAKTESNNYTVANAEESPLRLPTINFEREGSQIFFGFNYIPRIPLGVENAGHGDPLAITTHIRCMRTNPDCSSCPNCKVSCLTCPSCVLHLDCYDASDTVFVFYQSRNTPANKRVIFIIGTVPLDIRGGVVVVANARKVPHGVWAPEEADGVNFPWWGMAWVTRR